MRNICLLLYLLLLPFLLNAQVGQLSLEECYALAQQHYPLIKQKELITQSRNYSIENAAKGYLPQVSFSGQATYQSDVTRVPLELPNMHIEAPGKDQYRIVGEVNQNLYDGGVVKNQQQIVEATALVEEQKVEVELFKLKERINQLYFGALLLEEQLKQTELLKKNIQLGLDKVNAAIANGAALISNAYVLQADMLQAHQRAIEQQETKKAYLAMLGQLINQPLSEITVLAKPASPVTSDKINRPELQLFDFQKNALLTQSKLITARNRPKLGLFVQGGYGRPGLNMLNNDFDVYYIGGVRFSWSLSGLYTAKNERQLLGINRSTIDTQQETFLFNTNLALQQQRADIQKLEKIIQSDQEIIALHASIIEAAKGQLTNGAMTVSDYSREVNAEDQVRQNLLLHQVQLLLTQHNYNITSGN